MKDKKLSQQNPNVHVVVQFVKAVLGQHFIPSFKTPVRGNYLGPSWFTRLAFWKKNKKPIVYYFCLTLPAGSALTEGSVTGELCDHQALESDAEPWDVLNPADVHWPGAGKIDKIEFVFRTYFQISWVYLKLKKNPPRLSNTSETGFDNETGIVAFSKGEDNMAPVNNTLI